MSSPALARKFGSLARLFRNVWNDRDRLRLLLDSDNYRFLKFAPPGHFYSPIPDIEGIRERSTQIFDRSALELPGIDVHINAQLALVRSFAPLYSDMPFPDRQDGESRYYLDNEFFSYGDGVILYMMMRHHRPRRIVEVGSGFSSAAMLDIGDRFFPNDISYTFIEPHAERLRSLLRDGDQERCRILELPVQDVPVSVFAELREHDILFVDSSHVAKTRSDVVHLLFTVLPALRPGVLVHFHDIVWPFEYPRLWLDRGRAWNEAYFLRAFLQYNTAFEVVYFNSLMEIHHRDLLREAMPAALKTPSSLHTPGNTSLWIRKVG